MQIMNWLSGWWRRESGKSTGQGPYEFNGLRLTEFDGSFYNAMVEAVGKFPESIVYAAAWDSDYQVEDLRRDFEGHLEGGGERASFMKVFLENGLTWTTSEGMRDVLETVGSEEDFERWFPDFSAFSFHRRPPAAAAPLQIPLLVCESSWRQAQLPPQFAAMAAQFRTWMLANDCFEVIAFGEFIGVMILADEEI